MRTNTQRKRMRRRSYSILRSNSNSWRRIIKEDRFDDVRNSRALENSGEKAVGALLINFTEVFDAISAGAR